MKLPHCDICGFWHVGECPVIAYEREQEPAEYSPYFARVQALVNDAKRRQQSWELSGEEGTSPYESLLRAFKQGAQEARMLKNHQHEWNQDSDYCGICGADGRA